jgi:hypothetical protein
VIGENLGALEGVATVLITLWIYFSIIGVGCMRFSTLILKAFVAVAIFMSGLAQADDIDRYQDGTKSYFNFENLIQIINTKGIKTIEKLLPELPFSMRDEYVAMYHSRSLQDASFKYPRIILFGSDASLMLAFNGDSSQKGFNSLEVIQFRDATTQFEFRELNFDGVNRPTVTAANPPKCLRCHQSPVRADVDPRPNWEPYSNWLGAYGSIDGRIKYPSFYLNSIRQQAGSNSEFLNMIAMIESQEEGYKQYSALRRDHPRYKVLSQINFRDTLSLTQRVSELNFKRIVRLIKSQPRASFNMSVLKVRLFCNAKYADILSPDLFQFYDRENLRKEGRPGYLGNGLTTLSYIFEPFGTDTTDWSMTFNSDGRFAFSNRFGTPGNHDLEFEKAAFGTFEFNKAECDPLANSVRRAASNVQFHPLSQMERVKPLLNVCAKCHSGRTPVAPPIAFDNPTVLKSQLGRSGQPHGSLLNEIRYRLSEEADPTSRMPQGFHLAPYQNKLLIDYLSDL